MKLYVAPGVLYRAGDKYPADLQPRPKDRATGLSAFDSYDGMIAAAIEANRPLEPNDKYIILDTKPILDDGRLVLEPDLTKPGHWFIKPTDPAKMDEWITFRPRHELTEVLQAAIIKPVRRIQ